MKKGFTLIELIIVVVIIGILALIALPRYFANIDRARRAAALATMDAIRAACHAQFAITGTYPAVPASGTITADIGGSGTNDVVVTYNIPGYTFGTAGGATTAYITALHSTAANSLAMCIGSGKWAAGSTGDPGCP